MTIGADAGGPTRVGVLALQGGVSEHTRMLEGLGAEAIPVRRPGELAGLDALVIPGGESSVIDRLFDLAGLRDPLREAIRGGLPTLGTCAGLVLLASHIENPAPGQRCLGLLDIAVRRNAFGPQVDSMETTVTWELGGGAAGALRAAAIRAPEVTRLGPEVEVLSRLRTEHGERVIGVRQGHILAVAVHPELTGDTTAHQALLGLVRAVTPVD